MPVTALRPLRQLLSALAVGAVVLAAACGTDDSGPMLHPSVDGYPAAVLGITGADGTTATVQVRVADTAERKSHGLMEVPDLPDGTGMLFVYPQDHQGSFWMKNTLVPLDIAFISADGEILQILTMQPCQADPCPHYTPDVVYRDALEVPAGWFDRVGLDAGAMVAKRQTSR